MSRLFVRRSATAVGIYLSVALGFLATIVAGREMHSLREFGDYSTVVFATGFFQGLFDLTVEEALVKYGFRYVAHEDWGRLRRLFQSAFGFKLAGSTLGGVGLVVFALLGPHRLQAPMLVASGIPLGQSLEGLAGSALYLRSRYDIRSGFLVWSMSLRLAGIAIGAHYGLVRRSSAYSSHRWLQPHRWGWQAGSPFIDSRPVLRGPWARISAQSSPSSHSRASAPASSRFAPALFRFCSGR